MSSQHIAHSQFMLALFTYRKKCVIYRYLNTDAPALFRVYKPWVVGRKKNISYFVTAVTISYFTGPEAVFFLPEPEVHYSLPTAIWLPRHKTDKIPENRHMDGHKILKLGRSLDMAESFR